MENLETIQYLVETVRDPNAADGPAEQAAHVVRETIPGVAPDARIVLDADAGGGWTLTFWPVAG